MQETLECDNPDGTVSPSDSVQRAIEAARLSIQRFMETAKNMGKAYQDAENLEVLARCREAVRDAVKQAIADTAKALVALIAPCVERILKVLRDIMERLPFRPQARKRPPASLGRLHIRRLPPLCHKVDYGLLQPPAIGRRALPRAWQR